MSVWRPSKVAFVGIYTFAMFMVLVGVAILGVAADEGEALQGALFAVVAFGGPAAVAIVWVQRCRVVCSSDAVEVVGLVTRRRIGWHEVVGANPGYWGLQIHLRDGSVVVAGAVQKANVSVWLKRRTRSDELAELIEARAGAG